MLNIKFSPETIIMLPLAIGLDVVGIILVCFGLDDFGATDAVGILTINMWLLIRGKQVSNEKGRKGAINSLKNIFTGKETKFLIPTFGELIPYLGVLPFWTLTVFFNLTED